MTDTPDEGEGQPTPEENLNEEAQSSQEEQSSPAGGDASPHFWERFFAVLLDWFFLGVLLFEPAKVIAEGVLRPALIQLSRALSGQVLLPLEQLSVEHSASAVVIASVALLITPIIYFALFEASRFQASFGKLAAHLRVESNKGEPLTLPLAILRVCYRYLWLFTGLFLVLIARICVQMQQTPVVALIVLSLLFVFMVVAPFMLILCSSILASLSNERVFLYDRMLETRVILKDKLHPAHRAGLATAALISLLLNPLNIGEFLSPPPPPEQSAEVEQAVITPEMLAALEEQQKILEAAMQSPSPTPSPSPDPNEFIKSVASVTEGDRSLPLPYSYAARRDFNRSIELAFYTDALSQDMLDRAQVIRSFLDPSFPEPVLYFRLNFHEHRRQCDIPSVRSYVARIKIGGDGLQSSFPKESIEFSRASFDGDYDEIQAFSCSREEEFGRIVTQIVGSGRADSPQGRLTFKWNVLINANTLN